MSLKQIFEAHGVDEPNAEIYDGLLGIARGQPVRFMQLGHPGSLGVWAEYFLHDLSTINGVSSEPGAPDIPKVHACVVEDPFTLDVDLFGNFDVIVHAAPPATPPEIFTGTLEKWVGAIKEGGIFIASNVVVDSAPGLHEDLTVIAKHRGLSYIHNENIAVFIRR